jgi:hypothetical protein
MTRYFENHDPKTAWYKVKARKPTREELEELVRWRERALEEARKQLREYDAG